MPATRRSGIRRLVTKKLALTSTLLFIFQGIALAQELPKGVTPLTSDEIQITFRNVLDRATVLDSPGVTAETYWYASGTFVTNWWRAERASKVTGVWRVEKNERCVKLGDSISPRSHTEREDSKWRCGKIFRLPTGTFMSLNPDGSAHGIHYLTPLP